MQAEALFLAEVHVRLAGHYDLERWHWKEIGTPPLDVCLGAILVQHTAWGNVEKALANLRAAGADRLEVLQALSEEELAMLVRPAGTPLPKARRIKALVELVDAHGGFDGLFARPVDELSSLLLATYGIGPETADVILLYGARQPAIVHDAYTARLMHRLGLGPEKDTYSTWRDWLDKRLPNDAAYRRAHHAGIVVHCKEICRAKPKCGQCPLLELCAFAREAGASSRLAPAPFER
jgi:endonuclease-3 related protein